MIPRRLRRAGLWLVALGLLAWVLGRVSLREAWSAAAVLTPTAVAILVGVNVLALAVFGLRFWVVLRALGHPVSLVRASLYRAAGFGLSYFTPGPQFGGEPVQVLLAERRDNVPRSVAIASVALDRGFDLAANLGFLAAAALVLVGLSGAWFAVALCVVPVGYFVALSRGSRPLSRVLRRAAIGDVEEQAARFCRDRPRHLAVALVASAGSWAMLLGEYWLLVYFLGSSLGLYELLVGLAASRLAYLMLMPAGLGVLEAGQVIALRSLGLPDALGLTVSLIIRLRDVIVATFGLVWGTHALASSSPGASDASSASRKDVRQPTSS